MPSTSEYPNTIDTFVNPAGTDTLGSATLTKVHATQHTKINDAVLAVQTELGTNPKGTFSSVAARLTNLANTVSVGLTSVLGASGSRRDLTYFSGTDASVSANKRWTIGANDTAESSTQTGSDFEIRAFNNSGVLSNVGVLSANSGVILRITRSTGQVSLGGPLSVAGASTLTGAVTSGAITTTGLTLNGNASVTGSISQSSGSTATLGSRVDAGSVTYATLPVGMLAPWAGSSSPPNGWLLCDGSAVSRTGTYAALFAVIGTNYGAGDNSSTFNLPDLRGRFPVGLVTGSGPFNARGNTGGATSQTLTTDNLPAHIHSTDIGHDHGVTVSSAGTHVHQAQFSHSDGSGPALPDPSNIRSGNMTTNRFGADINASSGGSHVHSVNVQSYSGSKNSSSVGSGTAVSTVPPYQVVHYIIKF